MVKILGQEVQSSVVVPAGVCKTVEDFYALLEAGVGLITLGTFTPEENAGKPDAVHVTDRYSLNSFGLPNPGLMSILPHLPELVEAARGKALVAVSIAGNSQSIYADMALAIQQASPECLIELDLGCHASDWHVSNIIAGYDPHVMERIRELMAHRKVVNYGLKLPFYTSPQIRQTALQLSPWEGLRYVVISNTYPGFLSLDAQEGTFGIGGRCALPYTLAQTLMMRSELNPSIEIISTGGVESARDVADCLHYGAVAAGSVSAFYAAGRDSGIYQKLAEELAKLPDPCPPQINLFQFQNK